MYALRRIVAYLIDMGLVLTPITFMLGPLQGRLAAALPAFWQVYAGFIAWALSMGVPVVVVGTLVGLTGRTPGKLAMFLRVEGRRGSKPGVPAGLLRELVKAICASFIFGALYALYGVITSGTAFYDDWLGLDVEDLRPSGLTDVQKNWRKHMREARLREEREEREGA
jgi:hypothetical protein